MVTQLSGFPNPVHDTQQTFRALLEALARPGMMQVAVSITPPRGLVPSCAAAALTLFDLETPLWVQPGLSKDVHNWLLFHTGCPFTDHPQEAEFALLWNIDTMPDLTSFNWGTPEYPEASTSLLLQCADVSSDDWVTLKGPGIAGEINIDLPVSAEFWRQWHTMTEHYPLGVDAWCFRGDQILGIPRTACPNRPLP